MGSLFDAARGGNPPTRTPSVAQSVPIRGPSQARTNSVTASQARAARRREARRDEQAVAAWLRELAGRTR
jgi:hypothetical protein